MIFFLKKTKFIVPMIAIVLLFSGVSKVDARAMRTGDPCYKTIDNHDGTATTYTGSWVSYDGGTGSDGDCNFACGSAVKGGTVGVANSLSIDGTQGGTKLFQAFYKLFPRSAPPSSTR